VVCDLPSAQDGSDTGPTALELALMALADCGVKIFSNVCKKSNIKVDKVDVAVEAEKLPTSPVITEVTMKVNVSAKARQALLEAAWRRTEANCPVISIFTEPIPVKVEFNIEQE
jgi:uncharacterized OsmC-like protein